MDAVKQSRNATHGLADLGLDLTVEILDEFALASTTLCANAADYVRGRAEGPGNG